MVNCCVSSFLISFQREFQKRPDSSDTEWESVLELATRWNVGVVRQLSIDTLTERKMDAYQRILLGRKYHIHDWLKSGYVDLVKQPEGLTTKDAEKIGYFAAFHVSRLREEIRNKRRKSMKTPQVGSVNTKYSFYCVNCQGCSSQASTLCWNCAQKGNSASDSDDLELSVCEIEQAVDEEFQVELDNVRRENDMSKAAAS